MPQEATLQLTRSSPLRRKKSHMILIVITITIALMKTIQGPSSDPEDEAENYKLAEEFQSVAKTTDYDDDGGSNFVIA